MVTFLLNAGADAHLRSVNNITAMQAAEHFGKTTAALVMKK